MMVPQVEETADLGIWNLNLLLSFYNSFKMYHSTYIIVNKKFLTCIKKSWTISFDVLSDEEKAHSQSLSIQTSSGKKPRREYQ